MKLIRMFGSCLARHARFNHWIHKSLYLGGVNVLMSRQMLMSRAVS